MNNCSRRDFVRNMVIAGGAMAVAPTLAMADDKPADIYWANVGPVSGFNETWKLTPYPAEFGKKKSFIRIVSGKVSALSPKCTHQGCAVTFDAAAKQFNCPCHNATFSDTGEATKAPATEPLKTLQSKIEDGTVFVQSLTPPKS